MADELKADGLREGANMGVPDVIPVLPLRDTVVFPHAMVPMAAGRASSVALISEAVGAGSAIGAFAQLDPALNEPLGGDLRGIGAYTSIYKVFKQQGGCLRTPLRGRAR